MASARGESLAVTALSSPVAMTFLKPAAVRGTEAPASQGQAVTTSLSRWQGRHPGWRHHCQGQRAAPGRLERAAGGCADRVGPAAGGAAWQRRPALQHRTRGGPVKAGPSPPPRPPPNTHTKTNKPKTKTYCLCRRNYDHHSTSHQKTMFSGHTAYPGEDPAAPGLTSYPLPCGGGGFGE